VAAGEGWHEGVVGIVAARLVERFARPAIVVTHDGADAKGSGRSVAGVDLHALVGGACGRLTRWGGHPGAVGLQLAAADIPEFRRELVAAAEAAGVRAALARARVRDVDAVVGVADLTLATAEAMEALAPFGRGNPPVRLVVPGCEAGGAVRVGGGAHLQVRLRGSGANARAIGFGLGERPGVRDAVTPDGRYDAVVGLEVDRWQDLVGPKVVLEALETLPPDGPGEPVRGLCRGPCDAACPDRASDLRALLEAGDRPSPPRSPAPPREVRDRRGEGAGLALVAGLCGADGGVVAVVSDVARRRAALDVLLEPGRLGAEAAVLGGARCRQGPLLARLALARGGPLLAMLDYERLADVEPPDGAHVVLLDPPADPDDAGWALARAAGRCLHLAWGPVETAFALEAAEARWELRPVVTAVWRTLADGRARPWGAALEAELLGDGPVARPAGLVARALGVLTELGLVAADADGVCAVVPAPRRELTESARYRDAQARLDRAREFLSRAGTLHLGAREPVGAGAGAA
jgi:hypothetical protein